MFNLKIAVVHDWLVTKAGAEVVLERILKHFPTADLFSLIKKKNIIISPFHDYDSIGTSFLQKIPFITRNYRLFARIMPFATECLDLRDYDLIISSSWAFSHGVLKKKSSAKHLAYVHTPMRWGWDMEEEYLFKHNFPTFLTPIIKKQIASLRKWDITASQRPNVIIANSKFVQSRIEKFWNRESKIIYPPVPSPKFSSNMKHNHFVSVSRLVPYKKVDLVVKAFAHLPEQKIFIVGDGPEFKNLKKNSTNNVKFLGYISESEKINYISGSKGFIQASKEDFGIAVVESQACGIPVLAFKDGGASETVDTCLERPSGMLFNTQSPIELANIIKKFSKTSFSPIDCKRNALKFSENSFDDKFLKEVQQILN